MLSITARMENGNELSHKMSEGHRSYSFEKTEAKIDHAINASPPRKCSGINNLWGACRSCPNFEKVESPIMLRSEDSIPTESTGFHTVTITEKGGVRAAPCYKDLREFFERQNYYVSHSKLCWTYTGTHFEPSEKLMLQNFAQTHFNPYATTGMTTEFENLVLRTNPINPRYWDDSTKRKINFKNGVLDLETMNFLPHSKEYGFKYVLPYEYDPRATAPVFQKFLSDIMISDAEMMQILLEFGGYALSGDDCKGAKALFLVGEGSNGKSTFVKVLKKLAGHNNYQTISLKDFSNMERRHGLDGALFNIAEETPDRVADSNDFKNLVDGGELKVRRLFSDDYTIENRAKLIFTCNTLPESFDTSKGYRRRLLIIPFEADFTDGSRIEDKDMDLKLFKELPGIFNLMIEAYHGFTARGKKFTESSKATATLTEYEEMNNPVVQFIKDKLEVIDLNDQGPKPCWMAADAIFKAYLYYCEEETNQKYTLPRNKFYKRLETALPQFKKRWHKKNAGKAVLGVRMNSSDGKEF
jgi:putative DNA primase/helicase